ncbi:MAG TPA: sugar phosphate nucleotidyltransferase [Verrucomicrobiae bacterium]|nr:sugar phosphate nucleotidyltransferase [Verrucomicrobiae bacterium]
MNVTKAIIPVAGWGTRRLPITKAIEKSMLPVGNRPIIDYVVQDCIRAGITDIYFVVSKAGSQLEAFYTRDSELEDYLKANNKEQLLPLVTPPKEVNFHYIVQDTSSEAPYGTAIPVALCAEFVAQNEPIAVLMGDDFIYNADGSSELGRLIAATPETGSSMIGAEVPREDVSRYGVLAMDARNNFVRIVEKPAIEAAPSTLINPSKYVISADLLKEICHYTEQPRNEEYYITDPINTYVQNGGIMKVVPAVGHYLDGGTVEGWLKANEIVMGVAA